MYSSVAPGNSTIEGELLEHAESAIMSQDQASQIFLCGPNSMPARILGLA
jgi:hypothetical protein